MELRSAINRESIERARRVQEKLGEYLSLLDRVRELEQDPDLAAFLGSAKDVDIPESPPAERARPVDTPSRGKSKLLLEYLKEAYPEPDEEFEPEDVATVASVCNPEAFADFTPKQANGILRHLAAAGLVIQTVPGKRGKGGKMPCYKLAETEDGE